MIFKLNLLWYFFSTISNSYKTVRKLYQNKKKFAHIPNYLLEWYSNMQYNCKVYFFKYPLLHSIIATFHFDMTAEVERHQRWEYAIWFPVQLLVAFTLHTKNIPVCDQPENVMYIKFILVWPLTHMCTAYVHYYFTISECCSALSRVVSVIYRVPLCHVVQHNEPACLWTFRNV